MLNICVLLLSTFFKAKMLVKNYLTYELEILISDSTNALNVQYEENLQNSKILRKLRLKTNLITTLTNSLNLEGLGF